LILYSAFGSKISTVRIFVPQRFSPSHQQELFIQSYYVKDEDIDFANERYSKFHSIQHLGGVDVTCRGGIILPKLKYVRGRPTSITEDDEQIAQEFQQVPINFALEVLFSYPDCLQILLFFYKQNLRDFFRNNQEIEYLFVEFLESDYVPSLDLKLPKLKELILQQDLITKG